MKIRLLLLSFFIALYGFSQTTYITISSGDWDDPNIWQNGNIPTTDGTVILNNDIIINSTSSVNTIEINPSASLTVNSSANLTINSLDLKSNSTSYSSLISNGTITGTINYKRHINGAAGTGSTTGSNDLISPPLSGMTFGDLKSINSNILSGTIGGNGPFYLFGPFDNSNVNNYVLYEETVDDGNILNPGVGYRTGSTDGETYTFTGTVETNTITQPITTPSGGSIWNLIGNPYPSYIKLKEFLLANNNEFDSSSSGVYGYDGLVSDGWVTLNLAYAFDPVNIGEVITPGQGFFVASKSGGASVTFDTSLRTTGNSDDYISGRTPSVVTNVELSLSNSTSTYVTDIYFTDFSTLGLDPGYDSSLYGGDAPSAFSLYSHLVADNTGIPMAIQSLGETDYSDIIVPLGVNSNQGEQITFNITANTLPTTAEIYLDDNVANTSTLLNSGSYIITPSTNLNDTGRFYLRFSDSSLSIPEITLNDLKVYTNQYNNTIVISGELVKETVAKIFDLQGRLISTNTLQTSSERLQTINTSHLTTGIYIVELKNSSQHKTQKVIIN